MAKVEEPTVLFGKSKWIWAGDGTLKNSNVIMRRTFSFGTDKPPARALCRAACDTHYYLYVNGNAAVWCGGFNRGAHAYYDEFDIAKYLVKGNNVIVVFCQYYGNDGRDMVSPERAGFIFECNDLDIYSDSSFSVYENTAYKKPKQSNCCYAGHDILYDAGFEGQITNVLDPSFNVSIFMPATVLDGYPDSVNGILLPRPVPLERFSAQPVICKYKKSTNQFDGDTYTIALPHEMRLTPYFEVTGNGQEKITITTDRTECPGTFGDEHSIYHAHSVEYITKSTVNIFEALQPMTGQTLIFTMPRTVKVIKLGYREIGFDADPTCEFKTEDERLDKLYEKALNTLYCSLGSTVMDTPERERSMWLGDSSLAARALYLTYFGAAPIVKKVIDDVIDAIEDDVLFSCVPGNVPVDIPSHGLLALGEYGLFAQYRNFVNDETFLRDIYGKLCDYLMLWEMTEHGVAFREGNRRWYDNLYNIDEALLENALYYSACKFMTELGKAVGELDYEETFEDRMNNIAEFIESTWDGLGYTSREDGYDDRANAFIALCGLVPAERAEAVTRLLAATYNASPYMEWAVIEALCKLGRHDLALKRFETRYALLAESDDTTLGEDFNGYGTKCQSYQASVLFELIQLFGGIDVRDGGKKIIVTPDFTVLKDLRCSLQTTTGALEIRYKYSPSRLDILVENHTEAKVMLEVVPERIGRDTAKRTILLNKGKNKFTI